VNFTEFSFGTLANKGVGKPVGQLQSPKKDRSKKLNQKARQHPPRPYNKFFNFQDLVKKRNDALMKKKKKMGKRGGKRDEVSSSTDSDPITNSGDEICSRVSRNTQGSGIAVFEGVGLEIVLPQLDGGEEVLQKSLDVVQSSSAGHKGAGSGLELMLGNDSNDSNNMITVDKETSDAHHIIEIQEEIGMNFIGATEEMVKRVMEMEERDRKEKLVWEQEQGYQ
jgi:hypothetical protein